VFEVEVVVGVVVLGRGEGRSKRLAERAAANAALEGMGSEGLTSVE
jgi:dsRNA-specific ribonuclease